MDGKGTSFHPILNSRTTQVTFKKYPDTDTDNFQKNIFRDTFQKKYLDADIFTKNI